MKERDIYFDFLRGVAIIMVIGIHTLPVLSLDSGLMDIIAICVRQLLNCSVPIFLAISGYFIGKKDLSNKSKKLSFWKKQIPTVYIPCFVWSLGWFALSVVRADNFTWMKSLIMLICCGFSIYYFIALILQLYIITPYISPIYKSRGVIIAALTSTICIVGLTYMMQIEGKSFPLLIYAGPFFLWVIFFVMGIWYANHDSTKGLRTGIILAVIGYISSIAESLYYMSHNGGGLGIKLSAFIYSAGIIMILFSCRNVNILRTNWFVRGIVYIGEISFGIYLSHMYMKNILVKFLHYDMWILNWSLTLLLTVTMIFAMKLILPKKVLSKYFGIR